MSQASTGVRAGIFASVTLLAPSMAHAYLDPGSGSYAFQILVAGVVAAAVGIKVSWLNLRSFFSGLFEKRGAGKPDDD